MKINVKEYVAREKEALKKRAKGIRHYSLLILQNKNNPASNSYVNGKLKDAEEIGIDTHLFKINDEDPYLVFSAMLSDKAYSIGGEFPWNGIILQEPSGLTKAERENLLSKIGPRRDVDGFMDNSLHWSCTPQGIINFLCDYLCLTSKPLTKNLFVTDAFEDCRNIFCQYNIVIVGRGKLVGGPLSKILIDMGATVTTCNSKTRDLGSITKNADIVITAAGCRNLISADMLKENAIVVDASINFDEEGKLCGDCDKTLYDHPTIKVTPVPGGVGLLTRLELMRNVLETSHI